MASGAIDIDRKLRLTAAAVGARTRKDLAAAFRQVNPRTNFDVERANKWLQGRAQPRDQRLYDDWAAVIDVGHGGAWIADCSYGEFLEALATAQSEDATVLERRARAFAGDPVPRTAPAELPASFQGDLAGSYLCYSPAWSPYFAGRLIRGSLRFERRLEGFHARYEQSRVQDTIVAEGEVEVLRRAVLMHLREPHGRTGFVFSLFPPMSLVSVLGGLMSGVAVLGADPHPCASRIVMIRLPETAPEPPVRDCLLEPGASIAADLASFGVPLGDPEEGDRRLAAFFATGIGPEHDAGGFPSYRALVEFFDREWIRSGFPGA